MPNYKLYKDDNRNVLPALPENSIDTIITDPPYGINFMGRGWDRGVPGIEFWEQALRVAKPGAYMLVFGGTRTFHRMACYIEDAGWEIRDTIMWVYGSGRPAGMNVSKAIDKARGAEREVVGINEDYLKRKPNGMMTAGAHAYGFSQIQYETDARITVPATDLAQEFDDYHTCIKPAWEPVVVAMKPLDGNYVENSERWGIAGFNVGECRVERDWNGWTQKKSATSMFKSEDRPWKHEIEDGETVSGGQNGSFPCNLVHDGSDEVLSLFPHTKSGSVKGKFVSDHSANVYGAFANNVINPETVYADEGSAARFFYAAKASPSERDLHCQHLYWRRDKLSSSGYTRITKDEYDALPERERMIGNIHPTVKPLALVQWLVRLTKPPHGGVVLDQFMGSARTAMACAREMRDFIGVEMDDDYFAIAEAVTEAEYQIANQRLF